jgi:hypothetical protein
VNSEGVAATTDDTGPIGPVAVSALLFLVAASPLMRGGARNVALIVLEAAALAFLAAAFVQPRRRASRLRLREALLAFLVTSPLWLAFIYLVPIPMSWWSAAAGRGVYPEILASAGITAGPWLPLSLVPDATAAALLAAIPVAAAFIAGYCMLLRQVKLALSVFVVLAFLEVVFGVLQIASGTGSALYFGSAGGRPYGTFGNPNHFANYVAMALAAYVWLAWSNLSQDRQRRRGRAHRTHHRISEARILALWAAGAIVLLFGILLSRSRGAALAGLPAAMCAFAIAVMAVTRSGRWRTTLALVTLTLAVAMSLVGFDQIIARFQLRSFTGDASFRHLLAASTMEGAAQFWPWGSGIGTYAAVFPRFQPPNVIGIAEYAHHDYAQLLFEGGIFAVLLMAAFAWLAIARAVLLVRIARRRRWLRRAELAAALCGLGLLGFLLHCFVDFNMHIPANAIAAALLAGVYLRPLQPREDAEESNGD